MDIEYQHFNDFCYLHTRPIFLLMKKENRLTLMLNEDMLKWIGKQVDNGEFDNQSAGIRKCILIAKRVFETGDSDELAKFILGKDIGTK